MLIHFSLSLSLLLCTVQWFKGAREITNLNRTIKEVFNDYVRFSVKESRENDSGIYFLVARNKHGVDRAFCQVTVGCLVGRGAGAARINKLSSHLNLHNMKANCDIKLITKLESQIPTPKPPCWNTKHSAYSAAHLHFISNYTFWLVGALCERIFSTIITNRFYAFAAANFFSLSLSLSPSLTSSLSLLTSFSFGWAALPRILRNFFGVGDA